MVLDKKHVLDEYESILSEYGSVYNLSAAIDRLADRVRGDLSPQRTEEYIRRGNGGCIFTDNQFDLTEEESATHLLVATGYDDALTFDPLYFSFVRKDDCWNGVFIGTLPFFKKRAFTNIETGEPADRSGSATTTFDEKLLAEVLPEDGVWGCILSNGRTVLSSYRMTYERKIRHNLNKGIVQGYVLNKDSTRIMYGTGLYNRMYRPIYIAARLEYSLPARINTPCRGNGLRITDRYIVTSTEKLISDGFSEHDILYPPEPVRFYSGPYPVLSHDIDTCIHSLRHAIYNRSARLPVDVDASEWNIVGCIERSIRLSIAMQKSDPCFIKPMYNASSDEICYLLPLYIKEAIGGKPDLAMVISDGKSSASFKTIIGLREAYSDASVLGYPESRWLKREWCFDDQEICEKNYDINRQNDVGKGGFLNAQNNGAF